MDEVKKSDQSWSKRKRTAQNRVWCRSYADAMPYFPIEMKKSADVGDAHIFTSLCHPMIELLKSRSEKCIRH